MKKTSRRTFLQSGAAAVAAPMLIPSSAFGANEKLNIGAIGVGGRGSSDLAAVSTESIVALCDVDEQRLAAAGSKHPGAKLYHDYRELLEQENLDAVVVATPDHNHAPATMRAMLRDLHVYCEKPLTHTVEEARKIATVATQRKLATQMGTQNHEHPGYVRLVSMLRGKAIGEVTEVHVITDRPGRWWPQGLDAPSAQPAVPGHLHWNEWLGPAVVRPYHEAYVPFKWRGWWDFGCGAIGDMAIHLMDPAVQALELGGRPVSVKSDGPAPHGSSGPVQMVTHFSFPAHKEQPAVVVHWYEGTAKPPDEIVAKLPMNGSLFLGTSGEIAVEHGKEPQLRGADLTADDLPFSNTAHHQQWVTACKTGSATGSNFGYAGPFTELVLLGNVAYRTGEQITYDPATMSTGSRSADALLRKEYRSGWEV